jgi:predicted tellurium resistance membrane protein TerC
MDWLFNPEIWIQLVTLTALEIVLGIDNVVFISILAGKLPAERQARARSIGLALAMLTRIALLFSIVWLTKLTVPLFTLPVLGNEISGRDIIFIVGGLFLLAKSTFEINEKLEGPEGESSRQARVRSFASVIIQIILLDIVFSLDSVITAVGMANHIGVMIAAVVIAVGFMLLFSRFISNFVERHPTIKMLALSFLLLIGILLIADGLGQHISKGYVYFAMAFSVFVEMLNMKVRKHEAAPVKLRHPYVQESTERKKRK